MRTILLAAVLAAGTVAGCSKDKPAASEQATEKLPTMTMDEVEKAIAANEVTPVDCNADKTRKKNGVVPGAILISDEETFVASELPADKGRKLVFYCADPG
jgi:hypothetical protein